LKQKKDTSSLKRGGKLMGTEGDERTGKKKLEALR